MTTMIDRFRNWYDHERDCNAKTLTMLNSVTANKRATPEFQRALNLMAHLVLARRMWLYRLGHWPGEEGWDSEGTKLEDLPGMVAVTEKAWVKYMSGLDDAGLAKPLEWEGNDGQYRRWPVELILTQVSGHAWYHRGQIVELVRQLGGETTSTDYIFWNRPEIIAPPVGAPASGS
ncbi:MAG TPA: DinB family protein [candidate division Zixibacteria bacterium]